MPTASASCRRFLGEHGIAGAPTGGLRFCPHVHNTMEEIERTLAAVGSVSRLS